MHELRGQRLENPPLVVLRVLVAQNQSMADALLGNWHPKQQVPCHP